MPEKSYLLNCFLASYWWGEKKDHLNLGFNLLKWGCGSAGRVSSMNENTTRLPSRKNP
jgi:hypothetical protein